MTELKRLPTRSPNLIIDVQQNDIDTATPQNSGHCMIADAIKRQVPEAHAVSVDLHTIRWTDKKKAIRYEYLTPRPAQIGLLQFDAGDPVEPFSFQIARARITRARGLLWRRQKLAREQAEKAGQKPVPQKRKRREPVEIRKDGNSTIVVGGALQKKFQKYGFNRAYGLRGLLPNQIKPTAQT